MEDSYGKTEANVISKESNDGLICFLDSKTKSWVSSVVFHDTSSK